MADRLFMRRALRLASRARGKTAPNPMVGALLVKDGRIIAEDYHRKAGTPHAEPLVLDKAGRDAKGSTLYVTLEPCCHSGKRTPPCTDAIISHGVKRVVAAMIDPNPKVSGKGFEMLEKAGIDVTTGVLEKEAALLNEAYIKFITTGKPFVTLKTAMTLDGKIATAEGQSKWITGEKARALVHRLRGDVDAVLTAIGTVKADDPELTSRTGERLKRPSQPVRVVIDPRLEIPEAAKVLRMPPPTIIVTKASGRKLNKSIKTGVSVITYKGKLELDWLMQNLAARGIMSVLIEGGSSLNAHAFEDGIVDKIMFFIAPKIIGGRESFPAVGGRQFKRLHEAHRIRDVKVRRIGEDMLIEGYVAR